MKISAKAITVLAVAGVAYLLLRKKSGLAGLGNTLVPSSHTGPSPAVNPQETWPFTNIIQGSMARDEIIQGINAYTANPSLQTWANYSTLVEIIKIYNAIVRYVQKTGWTTNSPMPAWALRYGNRYNQLEHEILINIRREHFEPL